MTLEISLPGKLILFGEWAVLEGQPALATALSPRLRLKCSKSDVSGISLRSEGTAFNWKSLQDEWPRNFEFLSRLMTDICADTQDIKGHWQGLNLSIEREWPLAEGLGSSSALVLGLKALDYRLQNRTLPLQAEFWKDSLEVVQKLQGGRGSGLDLATQLCGGTLHFEAGSFQPLPLQIPTPLRLVHCGQKTATANRLGEIKSLPAALKNGLGDSVSRFLRNHDWIEAMNSHYDFLSELGVVPKDVQEARNSWLSKGWIRALKTTGAGGGDALMIWNDSEHEEKLRAELKERNWWQSHYDFGVEGMMIQE